MHSYKDEVQKVDTGEWSPIDFILAAGCDPLLYTDVIALARIYKEDGGERLTFSEFVAATGCDIPPDMQTSAGEDGLCEFLADSPLPASIDLDDIERQIEEEDD